MKRKCGIAVVSMILFILLCSSVCAEDEEIFDLREGEHHVLVISYGGSYYYYSYVFTEAEYGEKNTTTLRSIPEMFYDVKVYGYEKEPEKKIEMEYEAIETVEELDEFFRKHQLDPDEKPDFCQLKDIFGHKNIILGIVYPIDLNIEGSVITIEIISKFNVGEQPSGYYGDNSIRIDFFGQTEKLDRFSFVLQNNYRFWYKNVEEDLKKLRYGEEALSWKISEDKIEYLYVTFGTPEERLHWENYVNNVGNFIYVIIGIFLTITIPIMITRFEIRREFKWVKYCLLLLAFVVFLILFNLRINNFKLEEIPLETCLRGECLIVKINSAFTYLCIFYLFFLIVCHYCIDGKKRKS